MRTLLLLVPALNVLVSIAALAQQPSQSYSHPGFPPQTYAPQSYSRQSYEPQGFVPQLDPGSKQSRRTPSRRLFRCLVDSDVGDYCAFYTSRNISRGDPCNCNGNQGRIY